MQKTFTFLFSILFIFSLFLSSSESLALTPIQTSTQAEAVADLSFAPECVEFKNNLTYLDRDSLKNGEVTKLQNFLASQGYFKESATGYFGAVTTKAVAEFQKAQSISPAVGYVGPVTKTKIKALTCGGTVTSTSCPTGSTGTYPNCALVTECPEGSIGAYPDCKIASCSYAPPPLNCTYVQGTEYNAQTQCGLVLKCEGGDTTVSACVELSNNLILTDRDANKNGEVTKLQKFLVSKGYLKENPTGYFGVATLAGVVKFQKENNISPAIGYVGSLTRDKIKSLSCGGGNTTINNNSSVKVLYPNAGESFKPTQEIDVKYSYEYSQKVHGDEVRSVVYLAYYPNKNSKPILIDSLSCNTQKNDVEYYEYYGFESAFYASKEFSVDFENCSDGNHPSTGIWYNPDSLGDVAVDDAYQPFTIFPASTPVSTSDFELVIKDSQNKKLHIYDLAGKKFKFLVQLQGKDNKIIAEDYSDEFFSIIPDGLGEGCIQGVDYNNSNTKCPSVKVSISESKNYKPGDKIDISWSAKNAPKNSWTSLYFEKQETKERFSINSAPLPANGKITYLLPPDDKLNKSYTSLFNDKDFKIVADLYLGNSTGCGNGVWSSGFEHSLVSDINSKVLSSCFYGSNTILSPHLLASNSSNSFKITLQTNFCLEESTGLYINCVTEVTPSTSCVELSNNLILTDRDANKNDEVTKLQKFLFSKGYLKENPTGYFGPATLEGVVKFQKENNLSPAVGYVGSLTRDKIKALSCGNTGSPEIKLISPNGGEKLKAGDKITVKWTSKNIPSSANVIIGLYKEALNNYVSVASIASTINDSEEIVTIPQIVAGAGGSVINGDNSAASNAVWFNSNYKIGIGANGADDYSDLPIIINMSDAPSCPQGTAGVYPDCKVIDYAQPTFPNPDLKASSVSVASGGSTTLTWTTENSSGCTASANPKNTAWIGTKATTGSQTISNLTQTTEFTLTCSGFGGSDGKGYAQTSSVDVGVYIVDNFPEPVCPTGTTGTYPNCVTTIDPKPTVTLTATPDSVQSGGSTQISWTTKNATVCTASGGWTGTKATSGSQVISNLQTTTTFNLSCVGIGGLTAVSTDVGVYIIDYFPNPICPTGTTGTYPNCITTISYPAGCTSNTGFSTTTGQPCDGTILPCPTGTTGLYPNCVTTAVPSLIRTYPKGGETFNPGDTIKATWEGKNLGNRLVNIGLSYNKYDSAYNFVESVIKRDLPNTGEASITIPSVAELKALNIFANSFYIHVWVHELVNGQYENVAFDPVFKTFKINIPCEAGQTGEYPNCITTPTPKPTVTITASPSTVPFGGQTTLTWSSTNATTCVASNSWSGSKNTSGTLTFGIYVNNATTYSLSCTGLGGTTTESATVSVTSDTNASYPAGCTSNTGFSTTTGQSCSGASVSSDLTPRIAYWTGKASQYVNSQGVWTSDPANVGSNAQQLLSYCKKWYPTTTSVVSYQSEAISTWKNLSSGIVETVYGTSPSYKCVGGVQPTVLGVSTSVPNSCSISQTLMKGINNDEVKCLQQKLNQKGYTVSGTEGGREVTQFGVATLSALRKFQAENGLTVDGILGLASRNKINQ